MLSRAHFTNAPLSPDKERPALSDDGSSFWLVDPRGTSHPLEFDVLRFDGYEDQDRFSDNSSADLFPTDWPLETMRLSIRRILIAFLALAIIAVGAAIAVKRAAAQNVNAPFDGTWFAPYVDATLTPSLEFQDPAQNPSPHVVLGFVVSSPSDPCTPSWGGYFDDSQADSQLTLARRLTEYESEGGTAIVSFGGSANKELALGCTNVTALENAYRSVITHYSFSTIDFDLEGQALTDVGSIRRRAQALSALQQSFANSGHPLAIWLTLPVATNGLPSDAATVVSEMLGAGVTLAGVNLLTMDFGQPEANMLAAVEDSITQSEHQLAMLYRSDGIDLSTPSVWNKLGATVMIGQNDTVGEQFTVDDARSLTRFATEAHLGRISMWSLNRDSPCGPTSFNYEGEQSNVCSGVIESGLEFTDVFDSLAGDPDAAANPVAPAVTSPPASLSPANNPYPQWQPWTTYTVGYLVVRQGFVYQAKWYNQGVDPIANGSPSPWQLIGPVLPTDHAPTTTTLAPNVYPAWTATSAYSTGARVLYDGLPYQAKWYNSATSPAAAAIDPSTSPWSALFTVPGEPVSAP